MYYTDVVTFLEQPIIDSLLKQLDQSFLVIGRSRMIGNNLLWIGCELFNMMYIKHGVVYN